METPRPAAVLELFKPVTWFPPMWAFGCGVVSSGAAFNDRWLLAGLGILLAGPMVCATSQAVNDWFDRHVDAINEPERPIPSGRIPGQWGLYIAIVWSLVSLALAYYLGPLAFAACIVGLILAWAYSAPPVRLKENGWWGNLACGLCYESLPWFTGAVIMVAGWPHPQIMTIALLYGLGAHGIMTLNDFKAIEGDQQMGVRSLPVQLGPQKAAKLACIVMWVPQAIVLILLINWDYLLHAAGLAVLLAAQTGLMFKLLQAPREKAIWYNATGTSLYVLGMLLCAFAIRNAATISNTGGAS